MLCDTLVYKNLRCINSLSDLYRDLSNNPSALLCCGFDIRKPIPSVERFSSFLRSTPNKSLAKIRNKLVSELIQTNTIKGEFLSIDSCPILANVKENNLKTNVKNRFDKNKFPKGDKDSRLGVIITFPKGKKKSPISGDTVTIPLLMQKVNYLFGKLLNLQMYTIPLCLYLFLLLSKMNSSLILRQ